MKMLLMLLVMVGMSRGTVVVRLWGQDGVQQMDDEQLVNKDLKKCIEQCGTLAQDDTEGGCTHGCEKQHGFFEDLKKRYRSTPGAKLLGTALDQCWEECGKTAQEDGLENQLVDRCSQGCQQMRSLQKESQNSDEDHEAENAISSQDMIESNEIPSNDDEDNQNWSTVILVRPNILDQHFAYIDQVRQQMFNWMFQDLANVENENQDDTFKVEEPESHLSFRQYAVKPKSPEPSASLYDRASSGFEKLKSETVTSFNKLKDDVKIAFSSRNLNDTLMTILVVTSLVLMIFSFVSWVHDSCFARKSRLIEDDGNYYKLASLPHPTYLPTYDDCIKADKASLKEAHDVGEYLKVNLSYPAPIIVDIKEDQKEKENL